MGEDGDGDDDDDEEDEDGINVKSEDLIVSAVPTIIYNRLLHSN
jgi:hypothetical protein